MDVSPATLIGIFDRIGIVAFAFAGVEVGLRRRFDIFGLVVMGVVTAAGGGLLRDVILGRPPFILVREDYLLLAAGASLLAIPVVARDLRFAQAGLRLAGSLGLGAFAAAGALAAIQAGLTLPAVILLAILTATGGGVIRDLLADRVPLVLTSEVNATAAALGAVAVWALEPWSAGLGAGVGILTTALVQIGGTALNLHLPVPSGPTTPAADE